MKFRLSIFIANYWDALLASAVSGIFIFLFTRHSGIGISPDSVTYYTVAINTCEHFSFADFNGVPLVDFPPWLPFFPGSYHVANGVPATNCNACY